jgi:hypothetical protein
LGNAGWGWGRAVDRTRPARPRPDRYPTFDIRATGSPAFALSVS